MSIRVLQMVADGSPGGGTTHVLQLLAAAEPSAEMALLTQRDSYLARQAQSLGVPLFVGDFFRSRFHPTAVQAVTAAVRTFQPGLLHCHGGRAAFFASFARPRPPVVYTIHGFHFRHKQFPWRQLGRWAECRNLAQAQQAIFVCEYDRLVADQHRLLPRDLPHTVIYNGVPEAEIAGTSALAAAQPDQAPGQRADATCASGALCVPRVGWIGRLVDQKDPLRFLDVVEHLPNCQAVLAGGGPLAAQVQAEIVRRGLSPRVQVLGPLSHQATLELLPTLDVLVMTSVWEGLPLLPLEAMTRGVPVVATAVGGLPEIIVSGESGLLGNSVAELAQGAGQLLHDPRLRSTLIAGGRQRVAARFSERAMLEAVADIYRRLTAAALHRPALAEVAT